MGLALLDVHRIANEVANQESQRIEVIAATPGESDTSYAEIVLTISGCRDEPCLIMIGVSRDATEAQVRLLLRDSFRRHLSEHRPALTY